MTLWRTHEDSSDSDVHVILIFVGVHHRLRNALSLVVASPNSNCIHIAPVRLGLGVNLRVSVDFASASQQDASLHPLSKAQHVDRPHCARLYRLDRIVLVVRRAGRACEVIYLIDFEQNGLCDVVSYKGEVGMLHCCRNASLEAGTRESKERGGCTFGGLWPSALTPVFNICLSSSKEIVQNNHFMAF